MEASMIDKKLSDKSVYFELSIGNAGNSLDGHNESQCSNFSEEGELQTVDVSSFNSMTNSCKPISHDKQYYYLPYWDYKPCMNVRCQFPDLRRRMCNSNMIAKISDALVSEIVYAMFGLSLRKFNSRPCWNKFNSNEYFINFFFFFFKQLNNIISDLKST